MAALGLFCLPIFVWIAGGDAAFTMYASSTWFRLELTALGRDGASRPIAPSALSRRVTRSAAPFLAGGDHFRRTYGVAALRAQLGAVARVACDEDPSAESITITLFERAASIDGPERTRTEKVACAR
jgi:hypothetical protein